MTTKTKKQAPVPVPTDYKTGEVAVPCDEGGDLGVAVASYLTRPEVGAAAVIEKWQCDTHDVNALVAELGRQVEAVNGGDLRRAEGMLIAQAHSLNEIFVNLARRSTTQKYLKQWEAYMRMAMKAQGQCRMTLETLAAMKNPPVVFARQANIAHGPQQVNNATTLGPVAPPAKPESAETELLEVSDGEWLDTRAAGAAGGSDPHLETVATVHRPAHR